MLQLNKQEKTDLPGINIYYPVTMKYRKIIRVTIAFAALSIIFYQYAGDIRNNLPSEDTRGPEHTAGTNSVTNQTQVEKLYKLRQSDIIVEVTGEVLKLLPDDNEGSRHQKFIIKLNSGHTLLVSHNIDLAPRVQSLQRRDSVTIKGEYEWSEIGGVIHWTHHDPAGRHEAGWIEHQGKRYY